MFHLLYIPRSKHSVGRLEHKALGEVEKFFPYVGQRYGALPHNNKGTATALFLPITFQIADGGEIRLSVVPVTFFVNNFLHLASGSNLCVSSFLSPDTFSFRALQ